MSKVRRGWDEDRGGVWTGVRVGWDKDGVG